MGVLEKLRSLIAAANRTTGKTDADMTAATQSLIDGFGGGGGGGVGELAEKYARKTDFTEAKVPAGTVFNLKFQREDVDNNGIFRSVTDKFSVVLSGHLKSINFGTVCAASKITSFDFRNLTADDWNNQNGNQCFAYCSSLKEVLGEWDFSKVSGEFNCLSNCYALETFSVKPGTINCDFRSTNNCRKMSNSTIRSFVGGLADTTSGKTLVLSRTAVDAAFAGGSTGQEWADLVETKPNWTITLA